MTRTPPNISTHSSNVAIKKKGRSKIANGKTLFTDKVDLRSAEARRFKEILRSLTNELNCTDVTESQRSRIKCSATLIMGLEKLQARGVNGEAIDVEAFASASGQLRRMLEGLGLTGNPTSKADAKAADAEAAIQRLAGTSPTVEY